MCVCFLTGENKFTYYLLFYGNYFYVFYVFLREKHYNIDAYNCDYYEIQMQKYRMRIYLFYVFGHKCDFFCSISQLEYLEKYFGVFRTLSFTYYPKIAVFCEIMPNLFLCVFKQTTSVTTHCLGHFTKILLFT